MGDGGVACVPSQHFVERFVALEKLCGGNGALAFLPEQKMRELERKAGSGSSDKGRKLQEKQRVYELEKGEFVPERRPKGVLEKGENHGNGELENGEFLPEKRQKGGLEKGEFVPEKSRRRDAERLDLLPGRGRKVELEKGEFVPENGRKWDRGRSPEDRNQKKDGGRRNESDRKKRSSTKLIGNSHVREEETGSRNCETSNGKSREKEHGPENWLKRHCVDAEGGGRKLHSEYCDHSGSKSRRISEESSNKRQEHLDKLHRSSNSVSKVSASRNSSSRPNESSLPPRGGYIRHGRSPDCHLERSPNNRNRHHDHRDRSPLYSDRSPHDRVRRHEFSDKTPGPSERSSHERSHVRDRKDRSSGYSERSHNERSWHLDSKDRTSLNLDHSPHDRSRISDHLETSRRSRGSERKHSRHEDRHGQHIPNGRNSSRKSSGRQSDDRNSCPEKSTDDKLHKEKDLHSSNDELGVPSPPLPPPPAPPTLPPSPLPPPPPPLLLPNGTLEELPSTGEDMEEDMDICDTPPHAGTSTDTDTGKWFYLDHFGIERGPSRLIDLKKLVEDGVLLSDHLIKHSASDRWVTVENAASPLVSLNSPSIVSDAFTQMASPPEASGNLLCDAEDFAQETPVSLLHLDNELDAPGSLDEHQFDKRVGALLNGFDIIPGKELEIIGEALGVTFVHAEWENWAQSEGFTRSKMRASELPRHLRNEDFNRSLDFGFKETSETRLTAALEREHVPFVTGDSTDWLAGKWTCRGGDWKRTEDISQDRYQKRKLVLNEGYPLCQMPKCGNEDPRWDRKDDLYRAYCSQKVDLPSWAYFWSDDKTDSGNDPNKSQIKQISGRGMKGTMLPVIRINACVVKDHGSSASESRIRVKSNDRHSSKSIRSYSGSSEKAPSTEGTPWSKKHHEHDLHSHHKPSRTSINIPKDHVCSRDELALHLGGWYYLDGASREHGPYSFPELQELVDNGAILQRSSVFRKVDNIWVPVSANELTSGATFAREEKAKSALDHSSLVPLPQLEVANSGVDAFSSFHSSHPQFIGFMCGKLHELVMKSYKRSEFAAAINGVLDPWLIDKQPKELDKPFSFNFSITKSSVLTHDFSGDKFWRSDEDNRSGKRARLMMEGSEGYYDIAGDLLSDQIHDYSFEDLYANSAFDEAGDKGYKSEGWGLLNPHILARIFHFLRDDMKSLIFSAATCKHWKSAIKIFKDISKHVNFSSAGPNCTDSMFQNIMSGYDSKNIAAVNLARCTSISSGALEEVLQSFPGISTVDIRGCSQFRDLTSTYQNVKWIKSNYSHVGKTFEEYSKVRTLKQITEKSYSMFKPHRGSNSYLNISDERGNIGGHDFDMHRKSSGSLTFRQGYYRRTKLLDARKSPGALTRDAQLKQLIRKKSENVYRKLEPLIADSLKNIMKENCFEFLVPKVAEIEDRMKSGYYVRRGLSSVKDDIRHMCRNVLKAKRLFRLEDMNRIISPFLQLVERLEKPKQSYERDAVGRPIKDDSDTDIYFAESKWRKKQNKIMSEKRYINKTANSASANGGYDNGAYALDRQFKRSLSKLNRKWMNSESETSDDEGIFDEDISGEAGSTGSETESDLDFHTEAGKVTAKDTFSMLDEAMYVTDDRDWGARMTKASLVPPVTRKYEVIDRYLIVADEAEVKRKMTVALPEDYKEKLNAQSSGIDEADMEIPEVKDYKPRKLLEEEVLEQEVYGIDPYTHNLLLDTMPKEMEWPLGDKHQFIEQVLLRALNKQVRRFTGSGNAPMVYQLQPVVEEIRRTAEEDGDTQTMRMCQAILKAMRSRPDDNYVAYRKGLGVVCDKENGFTVGDFVVEFLGEVYPAWKWYEKQDGIRSLQKDSKDPLPEFYNIYLERPKGDRDGYDLVVVDAMHKANYASRICHSCRPNCEAKVTAVNGQYQIGIYTVKPISYGEEITFDYNSVTESKDEYEASVCLCGSQVCRGSYLNLTGEEAYQNVLKESHGLLDRHKLMILACEENSVSEEDYILLGRAGLGPCLLDGLPDWLIAYSAHLVRFMNFERTKLPDEILKHNYDEKIKYIPGYNIEDDRPDAEVQAEGVYNQRLQNMAVTIDKVRYVMRNVFGDPMLAPPPLERLSPEAVVSSLWKGDDSVVEELLKCLAFYIDAGLLNELKSKIRAQDPSASDDINIALRKSLLWLRDELRDLPCSQKCRNDAAADLIHIYAYTKYFFRVRENKSFTSPPVYISPLDMGPKYMEKMGSGFQEYCKTYGENYCLGQLIYWHNQTNPDPDQILIKARRGCLVLPDIASFYASSQKVSHKRIYGAKTLGLMLLRMEKQPQRPWPKDQIWEFRNSRKFFGSPMLDSVLDNCPLDRDMMHWLKNRPAMFQGARDG